MRSALLIAVVTACLSSSPAGTAAQEPGAEDPTEVLQARGLSATELGRLAEQLASPAQRASAVAALTTLHAESLPGIASRLTVLRRHRPDAEQAKAAFTAFRHATGSRRVDDVIDLAQGVLPALTQHPDGARLAMAEPLLLLRSLEGMAGEQPEAGKLMAELLTLDADNLWDFELRLARERGGMRLLPALISLRSHGDSRVRRWAQAGVRLLGMEDPAVATLQSDPHLTAAIVRAYSEPLDYPAMPVLVRMVGADRLEVRKAARAAVARFGKNAIWQLRQLHEEVSGKGVDRRWEAERVARELYAALDRGERTQAEALLSRGMSQFVAGDLREMQQSYDALLSRFPEFEQREKMAAGYAALGDELLADDADDGLRGARDAYARALRLTPEVPEASEVEQLRAKLAFAEAELALTDGVVDLHRYDQALAHDPHLSAALAARDGLSGARAEAERRHKRLAAAGAIALLLTALAVLLRGKRDPSAVRPHASRPHASPVS